MKNKNIILAIFVLFLGIVYLLLPGPVIPELYDSLRSKEPGDTYQFPGIWAFYTDLPRREVIDYFRKSYGKSWLWNLPLPVIRLNHPPEYCQEKIRDTQWFTYCEELINPLKESLMIGGWTPREDEFHARKSKTPLPDLIVEGKVYKTKVILKHIESPVWARILVWIGIWVGFWFLGKNLKEAIFDIWQTIKKSKKQKK